MHLYNRLLPSQLSNQIHAFESKIFSQMVRALSDTWRSSSRGSNGGGTLRFVPIINTFLESKTEFDIFEINLLIKISFEIFFHYFDELFVQIRWGKVLITILRKYKNSNSKLNLNLNWRPLYECLKNTHFSPSKNFQGPILLQNHNFNLLKLIKSSRNYFSVSCMEEIWNEFSPHFNNLSSDTCLESIGFLSLFFPSYPNHSSNNDHYFDFINNHLPTWFDLWSQIPFCPFWDDQWLSLIARTVKVIPIGQLPSDTKDKNADTWRTLLFTKTLNGLGLPVGKSQGNFPNGVLRKVTLSGFFSQQETFFSKNFSGVRFGAKIFFYSLDFKDVKNEGRVFLNNFLNLVDLIVDFYHPLNSGSWMDNLESFLKYSVHYFFKRVFSETLPPLDDDVKHDVTKSLLCLIRKSQFSKSNSLASVSSKSLYYLSYIYPELIFAHIIYTFNISISTETATHQLKNSLLSLSLCTRPIFLFSKKNSKKISEKKYSEENSEKNIEKKNFETFFSEFGQEFQNFVNENFLNDENNFDLNYFFSFSLTETLPGIDYNDTQKTFSVLCFYLSFFSCIRKMDDIIVDKNDKNHFPLDWSLWIDEFLTRVITIFGHMEAPTMDLKNSSSFLRNEEIESVFCPLVKILFSRLSPSLCEQGIQKVAHFVANDFYPNAKNEILSFLQSIAYSQPLICCHLIIRPLLSKIISIFEDLDKNFSKLQFCPLSEMNLQNEDVIISSNLEKSLCYYICMLSGMISCMGNNIIQFKEEINKIIFYGFNVLSEAVNEETFKFLSNIFHSLLLSYPINTFEYFEYPNEKSDVENWIGKHDSIFSETDENDPAEVSILATWHTATSDEIEFAQLLFQSHFESALLDIRFLTSDEFIEKKLSKETEKKLWRISLLRIKACLFGSKCAFSDFESQSQSQNENEKVWNQENNFSIFGFPGNFLFEGKWKNKLSKTLKSVCEYLSKEKSDDLKTFSLLVSIIDLILNYGSVEYDTWRKEQKILHFQKNYFSEPKLNNVIGKRRPAWLVRSLVASHASWRNSQFKFRAAKNFSAQFFFLPEEILTLTNFVFEFTLNKYKGIRSESKSVLEKIMKRFPTLTDHFFQKISEKMWVENEKAQNILDKNENVENSLVKNEKPKIFLNDEDVFIGCNEIFATRSMNRRFSQDWFALKTFIYFLLDSSNFETQKAQNSLNETLIFYILRFSGVPKFFSKKFEKSDYFIKNNENNFLEIMKKVSTTIYDESSHHWRYVFMANLFSFLLLPLQDDNQIMKIFEHFLKNTISEIPILRPFSTLSITTILNSNSNLNLNSFYFDPDPSPSLSLSPSPSSSNNLILKMSDNVSPSQECIISSNITESTDSMAVDGVVEKDKLTDEKKTNFESAIVKIFESPSFVSHLIKKISNDHKTEKTKMTAMRSLAESYFSRRRHADVSSDSSAIIVDLISRSMRESHVTGVKSYDRRSTSDTIFEEGNAIMFEKLCNFSHGKIMQNLFLEIQTLSVKENVSEDRNFDSCHAEIVSGILTSSQTAKFDFWKRGLGEMTWNLMLKADVDSVEDWRAFVCHVVSRNRQNRKEMIGFEGQTRVDFVLNNYEKEEKEEIIKLKEMNENEKEEKEKKNDILMEILKEMLIDGFKNATSSSQLAKILGYFSVFLSEIGVDIFGNFEIQFFEFLFLEIQKLMAHPSQQVREEVAILLSLIFEKNFDKLTKIEKKYFNDWKILQKKIFSFFSIFGKFCEKFSTALIAMQSKNGNFFLPEFEESYMNDILNLNLNLNNSEFDLSEKVVFWMQTVFHICIISIKNGSEIYFQKQISEILPSIFLLQEIWDKDFSFLSKQTNAYLKFIQVQNSSTLANFVQSFQLASASATWHARVALLAYMQPFVFRNIFYFDESSMEMVREIVINFVKDERVEVRELSYSVLIILIKSDKIWAENFRIKNIQDAEIFRKKKIKNSSKKYKLEIQSAEKKEEILRDIIHRHSIILSLSAFILSFPFDIPDWMPDLLMLLSEFAHDTSSIIKQSISKTFSEFKKTHADAWHVHERKFTFEQLEILKELTSSQSYFV